MTQKIKSIHPGEILNEELLKPMKLSQYRLAKDIDVSPRRINEIIHCNRSVTADTALRLGKYFNISPEFWLNLQSHYELEIEAEELTDILKSQVKIFQPAA